MARKAKNDGTPPGPVPIVVDKKTFEILCSVWCTQEEIAAHFKIHKTTLAHCIERQYGEDFATVYRRYYDAGTPSFRRERRVLSRKNASMSIWLGKMHLGEKEDQQHIMMTPEMLAQFEAFTNMFKPQDARKIEENNSKVDIKS